MSDRATMPDSYEDDGRVDSDEACPACGEDRVDRLVWLDDVTVECQSCDTKYHLEYGG